MGTRTEKEFIRWLTGASVYIGYARYGHCGGHGFVCATVYDESDELRDAVDGLSGGDCEAFESRDYIESLKCWIGNDPNPVKAMQKMVDAIKEYYFYTLNEGKED